MKEKSKPTTGGGRERRLARRFQTKLPLIYRVEGARPNLGRAWDIGESGLKLLLPERVPPSTPVQLLMVTRHGSITAKVEVVWAEEHKSTHDLFHWHGVRLLDLPGRAAVSLLNLLEALRASEAPEA